MAFLGEFAHCGMSGTSPRKLRARAAARALTSQDSPDLRHVRRLMALITMQNTLAGMKPSWSVLKPMMQTSMLLTPASAQPSQHRRPTRIVDEMVRMQDK